MGSFFAFLHHIAAFAFASALVVEFALIRDELSARTARKILFADLAAGVSAGVVLVVGLLRVFLFEKGWYYYFHSVPFFVKLSLFFAIALLSIYPTIQFLSWRTALKQGQGLVVDGRKLRLIRSLIHWELAGIVFLIAAAALMARGVGYVGA